MLRTCRGLLGIRERALLLVGFAGLPSLRVDGPENVEDLGFTLKGLRLALRRSKADQDGG